MRKLYILLCLLVAQSHVFGQRVCGYELQKKALFAKYPDAAERIAKQRAAVLARAGEYKAQGAGRKTTSVSPVPVIFHIVVNETQYWEMGGEAGIAKRCDSQIAVLNRDFNKANADSVHIPAGFKPAYGSANIQFGLAHRTPWGWATPGYDITIISASGFDGAFDSYSDAKHYATNGVTAWDVSKYLNIWCINFNDFPGLIGVTLAKSMVALGDGAADEIGVCIRYNILGKRTSATESYPTSFDQGRTLTHEVGHFFEIWHTWGDDGGLCPASGGADDGIADTPPQADATTGAPSAPILDACSPTGDGIMWMNFMDYCDDVALHMFTTGQGSVMYSQIAPGGGLDTLPTHPELLAYPPFAGIGETAADKKLHIFPNPAIDRINITWDGERNAPEHISIMNVAGQEVKSVVCGGTPMVSIGLSGISKGIYFVRCTFPEGSVMKKLVVQ
jgi:hypothetical protein